MWGRLADSRSSVFANVKSRLLAIFVTLGGLALTGAALRWMEAPLWSALRAEQPALRLGSAGAAAGQGVTLGLLGGFRAIVADFTWLRLHVIWEQRDLAATDTLLRLVTTIDPRPLYFWVNGARIIAFDMTAEINGVLNGSIPNAWEHTSSVVTENVKCPSVNQDGKCMDCRMCWSKDVKNISYGKH